MALILAIEPDRRQANQVNAVVRGRLHAEIVIADSAERALAALGTRVPDLILTSAFLSPNDETRLSEHLRALDGAAAHVHTLTIPVLAASHSGSDSEIGGMLGGVLRRGKAKAAATPEGCDPGVFAAQCSEYLERAEVERQAYVAAHPVENPIAAPTPPIESAPPTAPAAEPAAGTARRSKSKKKEEAVEPLVINTPAAAAAVQEAIARFAAFVDVDDQPVFAEPAVEREVFEQAAVEQAAVEQAAIEEPAVEAAVAAEPAFEPAAAAAAPEFNLSEMFVQAPEAAAAAPAESPSEEPDVYDIGAFDVEAFAVAVQSTKADPRPSGKKSNAEHAEPAEKNGARNGAAKREPPNAAPPPVETRLRHDASDKRIAASRPKPVQDEWGFFDPDQAGFAALLAKLDEIDDDEPARPPRPTQTKKR